MSPRGPRATVTVPAPTITHPDGNTAGAMQLAAYYLRHGQAMAHEISNAVADLCTAVAAAMVGADLSVGPDLIVEQGDESFAGRCAGCGRYLETVRPDQSFEVLRQAWALHVLGGECR